MTGVKQAIAVDRDAEAIAEDVDEAKGLSLLATYNESIAQFNV
jgi:hypothetical protein